MTTSRKDTSEVNQPPADELRRSTEHLRLALQAARMGTWDWDLPNNRVVWSEETFKIFGTGPEDFDGTYEAYLRFVAPEAREENDRTVRAFVESPSESAVIHFDHPIVTGDGQSKWIEARGRFLPDEQGRLTRLIGVVADITEQKRTEWALRERERILNATGRMGKIGGWEHDLATGKAAWTQALYDIIEIPYDREPPGTDEHLSYYPPQDQKILEQAYNETIENGTPFDLELQVHTAKGRPIWCRVQGEPLYKDGKYVAVSGTFQDVTERKRGEEREREAMARLRLAMESAEEGLWEWDFGNGLVTFDEVALGMLGYEPDLPPRPGEWCISQIHPNERPDVERAFDEYVSGESKKYSVEFRMRRKDGGYTWITSTAKTVRTDKEGGPLLIIGIHRDITERKHVEKELAEYRQHLERLVEARTAELKAANKELEAFAYSVSHDLRAPLRAIEGFTRILMEDFVAKLDDEGRRLGSIIEENTGKMGQLIDDLLAFSRLGRTAMHPSEIDMKNMARAIYHEATTPEDRQRVTFDLSDIPRAVGDTSLMRQVWMNLLSNALKFSRHRERAVISVASQDREVETVYSVTDNGTGFDARYKDKMFGVFQRLHSQREFEGTGVGLALVQRIIHRHGGLVWAEGDVDKGATFRFSLPRKQEATVWNTKNVKS